MEQQPIEPIQSNQIPQPLTPDNFNIQQGNFQSNAGISLPTDDPNQKQKRHRRSKNDAEGRKYECTECGKSYLSLPALTNHKKTKHGFGADEGDKKRRGRPRKEQVNGHSLDLAEDKFKKFFEKDIRRPEISENPENKCTVSKEQMEKYFDDIFRLSGEALFNGKISEISEYSFYHFVLDNWEKEEVNFEDEYCFSGVHLNKNSNEIKPIKSIPLDGVFFMYLKEVAGKTNADYFWFLFKFIIIFRECNNTLKEDLIKDDMKKEDKKYYSQIFNAEIVPDICNDFFMTYMKPKEFFGLNIEELIEAIQHFCYWIYKKEYTRSRLTLLENS